MAHRIEKDTLIITTKTKTNTFLFIGLNLAGILGCVIFNIGLPTILIGLFLFVVNCIGIKASGTWIITPEGITAEKKNRTLKWESIQSVNYFLGMGVRFVGEEFSIIISRCLLLFSDLSVLEVMIKRYWPGSDELFGKKDDDNSQLEEFDLATIDDNLQVIERTINEAFFTVLLYCFIIPFALIFCGLGLFILACDHYNTIGYDLVKISVFIGIVFSLLFIVFRFIKTKRFRETLGFSIFYIFGFISLSTGLISLLNGVLDSSKPVTREFVIKEKWVKLSDNTESHYIQFDDWKEPGQTREIRVRESEYNSTEPEKDVLVLTTCKGAFGYPWVVEYQIEEGEDNVKAPLTKGGSE